VPGLGRSAGVPSPSHRFGLDDCPDLTAIRCKPCGPPAASNTPATHTGLFPSDSSHTPE
jgi:hypothetical protein